MPCFHPVPAWRSRAPGADGRLGITFNINEGYPDMPLEMPCGRCIGCRLEKTRQWKVRLVHESHFHVHRWFVTLTYDDEHYPPGGALVRRDMQLFMKRLRKRRFGNARGTLRYLYCGEYGETTGRPHYHAVMFGVDFPDRREYGKSKSGLPQWASAELDALWGLGRCLLGTFTPESAGYVAGYVLKKVLGEPSRECYTFLDHNTGELIYAPPFQIMSRRPGIGAAFYDKFRSDMFPGDTVILKGKEGSVPTYYLRKEKARDEAAYRAIIRKRTDRVLASKENSTPDRLAVRKEVAKARMGQFKREI